MKDATCKPQEGNVVQTIVSGNTTIHFCDDSIQTDEASIRNILERYEQIGWDIFQSQNK
ncbi:hypothetical protein QUF95_15630 [Paenibacillus silvae]|uniref:hypothetical protein n=1 Tax=Paenibacillus silvae TaxID=1325358 RepID=UPI0025A06725|nr:hypothetical protein [Paenibacillus silvae]MDM5278829.1 hypothetical protein [Paenibacillus silvae]